MPGIPDAIADGPWWWVYVFLLAVVFVRAQATYWVGRGLRRGATSVGEPGDESEPQRRAARRFAGPAWQRAQDFVERWGFVGIPLSFLTIGFQTLVNAAAGFMRMRWDLYTLAMIPGCLLWAAVYSGIGFSLVAAWKESPWLFVGALVAIVAIAWGLTRLRRTVGSGSRTRLSLPTGESGSHQATERR
jgi:membrane protein DedA with SNARE-associated domain